MEFHKKFMLRGANKHCGTNESQFIRDIVVYVDVDITVCGIVDFSAPFFTILK